MEIKNEFGSVEYHLPNIPEAMELLSKIGLKPDEFSNKDLVEQKQFMIMSKLISNVGFLVDKIDLSHNNKKYEKYEDVLTNFAFLPIVTEIATKVMKCFEVSEEKKD